MTVRSDPGPDPWVGAGSGHAQQAARRARRLGKKKKYAYGSYARYVNYA
ncbi:MAG: hypothetical protein ACRDP3_20670 [Streptomyces sp.]